MRDLVKGKSEHGYIKYAFLKKSCINYWHVYRLIGLPPSKGDLYIYIVVRGKQVKMEGLLP